MSRNDAPDFLTLAEAAEYVGVSKDTLRRWDASGRLKPVRRPGSGYRFYRRPDLEPFRLEYRRAEQAADEPDHMFQTLTADIEANPKVREPQQGAHRAVRTHFEASNEPVILQIPVGCGKTGVIATLPFGVAKGRALVITPNLTIRSGVAESLDISNPKNFWRRTGALHDFSAGPFRAVLDGVDANLHDCNASQFVVTNIHQLASSADRWLPQFPPNYFDMIMIDEGHHNVAPSWAKVFDRFPNAKVVSLTATPFRGDGTRPVGKVIYRYPFTRAMVKGYIKQIHSRNVAPSELSFTYRDDTKRHTLEEVLALREHAWFRRGVALAPECNRHIVDASIKYLHELRERSGFRHQIIAVACSVDHARQVRGLYEERGLKAAEIYGELDRDKQEAVLADLRNGKLDCIVQVQMLGEGFDHPPLSVAAIFRPFASLSPYIQFAGRVMRVVHEAKPDHPDNHAFVVSHVGLNTDAHWDDFRELDFDDQAMVKKWLEAGDENGDGDGSGEPRRFDIGMLVDNEIVGSFINRSFLDPEDDRVLDEMLDHEIGAGLRLRDVIGKDQLRETLRRKQEEISRVSSSGDLPVQPQARRAGARKRLSERTGSVVARILKDLKLSPAGREVGQRDKSVAGRDNRAAVTSLLNKAINEHLGIKSGSRKSPDAGDNEGALAALDMLGDKVRDSLKGKNDDA
ncbi:DEAD/DEAH box helicase family protein [Bradyrhizobium viridifuturi]|jgi:DNA repair protein RadD|nr:DEAD/DEAH box helicase family protein [Bradyrhizobium viridifuturi]MBR1048227.1 DEAD/DEAH box helicase family protein [Bradyrhizobium viridifuturi]MBR1083806.1 DEAD/DEAH box helicase family protein [Bradyrhizobium viridifuturi]MBR1098712.1 DEAD/DEAH box helicase family protein [Bradyrhizobium viridifuturi]MBR1105865.1 DEAD/DEAH box helicase family protein [Bradyrhizobium viridifuturi]